MFLLLYEQSGVLRQATAEGQTARGEAARGGRALERSRDLCFKRDPLGTADFEGPPLRFATAVHETAAGVVAGQTVRTLTIAVDGS